jgi:hypothetical protein
MSNWNWLERFHSPFIAVFGALTLSVSCAFVSDYNHNNSFNTGTNSGTEFVTYLLTNSILWIIVGGLLLLVNALANTKKSKQQEAKISQLKKSSTEVPTLKRRIDSLQESNQQLKSRHAEMHQEHVTTWLKGLFNQSGFLYTTRISIYYEYEDSFSLLARYSTDPELKAVHKPRFQKNQGVISKAWREGEHFNECIYNYADDPKSYIEYMCDKYAFSPEQLEEINMKSNAYYGLSLTDAGDNVGVILCESLEVDIFTKAKREMIRDHCSEFQSNLCGFIREGVEFDKVVNLKTSRYNEGANSDIMEELGGNK